MKAIYTLTLTIILGLGITLIGFYSLSAAGAQVPNAIKPLEPQIVGAPLPYAMGRQFVHWVTESNRLLNLTYISSPFIVDANAILFVTPNLNPVGSGGIFNDHTTGLYYTGFQWTIINQDLITLPLGSAFNVLVPPMGPTLNLPSIPPPSNVFVHTSTAGNTVGNFTYLDHSTTNNHPDAIILVTPNLNPGGGTYTYEDKRIGVWYSTYAQKWAIFNQDISNMPLDLSFNVLVPPPDPRAFVHTATITNTSSSVTLIDNPLTNNHPNALVFATPNWNPGGVGGTYHNYNIGVIYVHDLDKWCIINQNFGVDAIPLGSSFNIIVSDNSLYTPVVLKSP